MKELKRNFRKLMAFCLVACMFVGMLPTVFAYSTEEAEAEYKKQLTILRDLQEQEAAAAQQATVAQMIGDVEGAAQAAAMAQQIAAQIRIQQTKVDEAYAVLTAAKQEELAWIAAQQAEQMQLAAYEAQQPSDEAPVSAAESTEPENIEIIEESTEPENVEIIEEAAEPENIEIIEEAAEPENIEIIEESAEPENVEIVEEAGEEENPAIDKAMVEEETESTETSAEEEAPNAVTLLVNGIANLWKRGESFFATFTDALSGASAGDTIELTDNVSDGDALTVNTELENIQIDFGGHTYNVAEVAEGGSAASFIGNGSVTVSNGTLSSSDADAGTVVSSTMEHLTFKDMLIEGAKSIGAVLGIYSGETDLVGTTSVDAGDGKETAIYVSDLVGDADLRVDTVGVINGGINVVNHDNDDTAKAWLHNGFYTGDIAYNNKDTGDQESRIMVDGGEYYDDVYEYVPYQTNYVDVSNTNGTVHSAGANVGWTAFKSAWSLPTFVNIRKSGGIVELPWGVLAKNSTDKFISVNGSLLGRGELTFVGCSCCCVKHEFVEGAGSEWYKGTEDGLSVELDADISYVTVDGKRVEAEIDGVIAEFDAELLEELSVGKHIFRFVLTDGCSVNTTLKIHKDEEIEWAKGSENGLMFEFEKDVKKVLVNNVKVTSEIDDENVTIGADVLEDLKLGRQTLEFVLEDMSHIVTSVTITK